jgi:hypothetical protein
MMRIIDGSNQFRRMIEADTSGYALRSMIYETENSPGTQIWVWDGAGSKKVRQDKFPAYKAQRLPEAEDLFVSRELFQAALLHTKAVQVRVPGWEGDDMIATLVRHYVGEEIEIVSTDKDMLQLETDLVRCSRAPIPGVPASEVRLYKTLCGDSSDNIPGLKGFGPKSWDKCNKAALRAFFDDVDGRLQPHGVVEWTMGTFGLSKACATWLHENQVLARTMFDIIGLYDIPWADMTANMIGGKSNIPAATAMFEEFLQ